MLWFSVFWIVCPPPPPFSARVKGGWDIEPPTKFWKRWGQGKGGGHFTGSQFKKGYIGKEGVTFFSEGGTFYTKNKLKSEIFNDKKNYKQKCFFHIFFWKIWFLVGCSRKTNICGGIALKVGLGQNAGLRWGLWKIGVWCFYRGGGVNNLMHTMDFDFFSRNTILKSQWPHMVMTICFHHFL